MPKGEIKLKVGNVELRFDGAFAYLKVDGKEVMLEYREGDILGRFLSDPNHYWQVIG